MTQNRILPLIGPVLACYLLADAAAAGLTWSLTHVAISLTALVCSLTPFFLDPGSRTDKRAGRGRAGLLGGAGGVAMAANVGAAIPTMVAQTVGSIAAVTAGWALFDLALSVPDRPRALARLRTPSMLAACVTGLLGVLASLPPLAIFGRLVIIPSATFAYLPLGYALCTIVLSALARALRGRLGSTPAALASNAWALLGLAPGAILSVALYAAYHQGVIPRDSAWLPGGAALVVALLAYSHAALVDPSRRLNAGDAVRRGFAGVGTVALLSAVLLPFADHLPAELPGRAAVFVGVLALAETVHRALLPLSRRVFAPFGGRLLDACELAERRVGAGARFEDLVAGILGAIRAGSGDPTASGRLYACAPALDGMIDAAGLPHLHERAMPEPLLERFAQRPGEVIVLADLSSQVVRRPELRALAETLERLDAMCAVPVMAEGELEGAFVVPRGRRKEALSLEEITALVRLADRLSGPLRVYGELSRAQAWAGVATLERDRVEDRVAALEDELSRLRREADARNAGRGTGPMAEALVAYSPAMRVLEQRIEDVAEADACVSLVAEPGCFVERLAKRVHTKSARSEAPFVACDLGYLPADDTLAALVGTEGEASTPGLLRLAHGGTLLLVDLPALSLDAQRALAEALATRTARPVGGAGAYEVDVRLIVTSQVSLYDLAEAGVVDLELSRWLSAVELSVPPLRERPEDIPSLTLFALDRACRVLGRPPLGISQEALDELLALPLPGNQRELEVIVQRAVSRTEGPVVGPADLALEGTVSSWYPPALLDEPASGEHPLDATAHEVERRMLLRALERASGNKSEAARLLGLKRTTFLDKFRRHDLSDAPEAR